MAIVRRYPLVTFFLLAYLLTWAFLPLGAFVAGGPLVAALIVAPITHGIAGLRDLGSRLIRWRVSWYWYMAALGLPLAVHLVTVLINVALGAPDPSLEQFSPWSAVLVVFAVRLINPMDGPMGEEPGWRGFAQPRLQVDRPPLSATAFLALLVALWHLPLVLLSEFDLRPIDLLTTAAVTFFYAWLFNRSGGSVLITLVAHATEGSINTGEFWTGGAAEARMVWLYAVVWFVVALGLVLADWRRWRRPAPEEATVEPLGRHERVRG